MNLVIVNESQISKDDSRVEKVYVDYGLYTCTVLYKLIIKKARRVKVLFTYDWVTHMVKKGKRSPLTLLKKQAFGE